MSYEQTAFCSAVGRGEEIFWVNPAKKPYEAVKASLPFSRAQIEDAASRLSRFAPFLQIKFPETVPTNGLIESPLREIADMRAWLHTPCPEQFEGKLLLKMDSHLAAAGSVKARGGIYEILHHAETLALEHGMLKDGESYARFADPDFREFFGKFSLHVGSTGNLGLSVGVIGAAFGFKTCVHMSADAKQWKKDLLRSRGVEVREYASDYSAAVAAGRKLAQADPTAYFVDDEQSGDLFLGYAVAAGRLQKQLDAMGIIVDDAHPLVVYLPCGVGGAPGGICYGLKEIYGDNAVCCYVEPTQAPLHAAGTWHGENGAHFVRGRGLKRQDGGGRTGSRPAFGSCRPRDRASGQLRSDRQRPRALPLPEAALGHRGDFHRALCLRGLPQLRAARACLQRWCSPRDASSGHPKRDARHLGNWRQPRPKNRAGGHAANRNERRRSFTKAGHLPIDSKSAQAKPARFLCVYSDVLR